MPTRTPQGRITSGRRFPRGARRSTSRTPTWFRGTLRIRTWSEVGDDEYTVYANGEAGHQAGLLFSVDFANPGLVFAGGAEGLLASEGSLRRRFSWFDLVSGSVPRGQVVGRRGRVDGLSSTRHAFHANQQRGGRRDAPGDVGGESGGGGTDGLGECAAGECGRLEQGLHAMGDLGSFFSFGSSPRFVKHPLHEGRRTVGARTALCLCAR